MTDDDTRWRRWWVAAAVAAFAAGMLTSKLISSGTVAHGQVLATAVTLGSVAAGLYSLHRAYRR